MIRVRVKELDNDVITIKNTYQCIDLDGFEGKWVLTENGMPVDSGAVDPGSLKPGEEKDITIHSQAVARKEDAEYFSMSGSRRRMTHYG